MSDKSNPRVFSKLWKQITTGGGSEGETRYCEKGHPMDPNWSTCAYCDAESRAHQKTASEKVAGQKTVNDSTPQPDNFTSRENSQRSTTMERGTTKIDTGQPGEQRGATRVDTSYDTPAPAKVPAREGKITGVLVTFSWRFQGELFVLYEGRNVIGSGSSCDIQITTDQNISSEHAVILCRAGRDELHDLLSTNGTFVNEKYVERDGVDITDGALIKTGGTVFEFRKITSGAGQVHRGERAQHVEEDHPPSRRPGETAI